jgi:adenylate kinase
MLGPPASGKGTQGRKLADCLEVAYLSTGALLREEIVAGTDLGRLAEPVLARGEYLPDELMCSILGDWLSRQAGGWVLDGFPRSVFQASFLDEWLGDHGLNLDAAIFLEAPFDELVIRIRDRVECPACRWSGKTSETLDGGTCPVCGSRVEARPDDSEANFSRRYQEFLRFTRPLVAYYQQRRMLCPCDATAPQDEVTAQLLGSLIPSRGD